MSEDPTYTHRYRQRLAGWHFAQEALSPTERDILHVAEGILREYDRLRDGLSERRSDGECSMCGRGAYHQVCERSDEGSPYPYQPYRAALAWQDAPGEQSDVKAPTPTSHITTSPLGPVLAVGQDWPEDYMCENCVTPWKCNGPHIADSGKQIEEPPSS